MKTVGRMLYFLVLAARIAGQAMIGLISVIILAGAISRYVFKLPLAFPDEFSGYLMVGVSIVGANWVLREGGHVSVDFVVRVMPPRVRAWVTVVTDILTVLCVAFLLAQVSRMTGQSLQSHTASTSVLRTPIGIIQLIMPIGFGILLIELLYTATLSVRSAISLFRAKS